MSVKRKGYGRPYPHADSKEERRDNLLWAASHPPSHKQNVVRKRNHQIRTLRMVLWHINNMDCFTNFDKALVVFLIKNGVEKLTKMNRDKVYE